MSHGVHGDAYNCPGADGLICIGGWLYSMVAFMSFPANKRCPVCNPDPDAESILEDTGV